jgi:uncharacterized protein YqfA (UPF0365 family)
MHKSKAELMNKETVYKNLLSYKIPEDDLKIIAEVFIYIQSNNINLLLSDLIKIYLKKINILRFFELIKQSVIQSVTIPFDALIASPLNKDDLLNLLEGIIQAKIENFHSTFSELEEYGKMKISLPIIIKTASQVKKLEPDFELSDFKNSTVFLYKPEIYINSLLKIKLLHPEISLKEIVISKYSSKDIEELIELHASSKSFKNKMEIHELTALKKRGLKICQIVSAVALSEKYNTGLSTEQIIELESQEISVVQIIKSSKEPESIVLYPITALVKAGYEIIFKIELKITAVVENFSKIPSKQDLIDSTIQKFIQIISNYSDFISVQTDKILIENKITEVPAQKKSSYKIVSFGIKDLIMGRNLKAEQLKSEQEILKQEAALDEAKLRALKAKSELAEYLKNLQNISDYVHSQAKSSENIKHENSSHVSEKNH